MIRPLALALAVTALPAAAQDPVAAQGLLSDEDFYRAVACAAPPGGACQKPLLRWDASRPIRVALREIAPAYLGRRAKVAESAVTLAVRALNGADAGFRLAQVPPDAAAEIEIRFLGIAAGAAIAGTGIDAIDGTPIARASTRVQSDLDAETIERAVVLVSTSLDTPEFAPALLGELAQAMGLLTGLDSPAYAGLSVLAEDDYTADALGPQDIMALKRHYARN